MVLSNHEPWGLVAILIPQGKAAPYVWQSYEEVARRVDNLASGLMQEDLVPLTPDKMRLLGIYLKNCPEWVIAEQVS